MLIMMVACVFVCVRVFVHLFIRSTGCCAFLPHANNWNPPETGLYLESRSARRIASLRVRQSTACALNACLGMLSIPPLAPRGKALARIAITAWLRRNTGCFTKLRSLCHKQASLQRKTWPPALVEEEGCHVTWRDLVGACTWISVGRGWPVSPLDAPSWAHQSHSLGGGGYDARAGQSW